MIRITMVEDHKADAEALVTRAVGLGDASQDMGLSLNIDVRGETRAFVILVKDAILARGTCVGNRGHSVRGNTITTFTLRETKRTFDLSVIEGDL